MVELKTESGVSHCQVARGDAGASNRARPLPGWKSDPSERMLLVLSLQAKDSSKFQIEINFDPETV